MSNRIIKTGVIFFLFIFSAYAQKTGSIEGIVTDEDNYKVEDVSVLLKETNYGTLTNSEGYYLLEDIPEGNYELEISFLGLQTIIENVSVKADEKTAVNFTLETGFSELSTVMIKGEAMREKNRSITKNTIKTDRIKTLNIKSSTDLLNQIPGVDFQDYHQGGTASVFAMRGFGEGGHGGDIAMQVDGVPLNESAGHADGYADMNIIVPLNIQEIDVYKGPSSVLFGNYANGGSIDRKSVV